MTDIFACLRSGISFTRWITSQATFSSFWISTIFYCKWGSFDTTANDTHVMSILKGLVDLKLSAV